ncbi:MAG: rhodanese-like domain-containing protein, partial [Coleofasciculus sp. Co-bin14]|nr:rhodanese-like domain-containing protein [Coleofasciculus sp. Co-bin14]
ANPMSIEDMPRRALETVEPVRELYVYGDSDEQAAQAAAKLREAGYENVSELRGGLAAWKAIGGPTEGNAELGYDASAAEYNVKARLDKHAEVSSKNL